MDSIRFILNMRKWVTSANWWIDKHILSLLILLLLKHLSRGILLHLTRHLILLTLHHHIYVLLIPCLLVALIFHLLLADFLVNLSLHILPYNLIGSVVLDVLILSNEASCGSHSLDHALIVILYLNLVLHLILILAFEVGHSWIILVLWNQRRSHVLILKALVLVCDLPINHILLNLLILPSHHISLILDNLLKRWLSWSRRWLVGVLVILGRLSI